MSMRMFPDTRALRARDRYKGISKGDGNPMSHVEKWEREVNRGEQMDSVVLERSVEASPVKAVVRCI